MDSLKSAIIGFEVELRDLENVFKLSQSRDEQSYENIMQHLHVQGGGARTIAEEMRKRNAGKGTIWFRTSQPSVILPFST